MKDGLDRLYDSVFVRPPGISYVKCVSSNPERSSIDVSLAKEQHRQYVSVIKEVGVKVLELPVLEAFPDSVFAYDPALLGIETCVIGRFGEPSRRGEEIALAYDLTGYKSEVGEVRYVAEPGTLEGGDILVTNRGLFVGKSTRTNTDGIRQLTKHMKSTAVRSIETDMFHMLCGCSYLSKGKILIVPEVLSPTHFSGFEFISIPKEESYASEAMYLGEGRVLIPAGFPRTAAKLKEGGYRPVEVELSEFYKGDGGVSCLSQPVWKIL
jgi:dimethylargininase